jgi:uncharacterized protein (DUF1800 family)
VVCPAFAIVVSLTAGGCASNPHPGRLAARPADGRVITHVLNRTGFGSRPGDIERVRAMGLQAYIEEQLHPEWIDDRAAERRLVDLAGLNISARTFAIEYYQPMNVARQEYTAAQKPAATGATPRYLRWRLQPIAAMSLPGAGKPVTVLQQASVTPEELRFQRENQLVMDNLQAQKLLRAVYSERQLVEVLTDFWFNHFNVDARKIEDRPVMIEYEREAIRPHVLGRFRDLLGATARSPAMLFYLDNWLSAAPSAAAAPQPTPGRPARSPSGTPARPIGPAGRTVSAANRGTPAPARPASPGRGLNENYGRELLELHTLGVDGGYTQKDVVEVARSFTGWTLHNPHDGLGFFFNPRTHDSGEKRVLGHRIKAGRGIEDGEEVLDLLARHPSTARFIATKLVRRFVADDPPQALVDRAARAFRRSDGDLRVVMRVILASTEFYDAYRLKVKTPFEYVASALRATNASIVDARRLNGVIGGMGEPLYQCQPPTGYGDAAHLWINSGTLVSRLNFAQGLATSGLNGAARLDAAGDAAGLTASLLAGDFSERTRDVINAQGLQAPSRLALFLGAPEFQRR